MKTESPKKKPKETRLAAKVATWAFEEFKALAESNGQTPASRLRLIIETNPKVEP